MLASPPALLQATALRCERAGRALVDGWHLALHAGETVWLRGANGSGKTTLLRTLAGLRDPDAGTVQRPAPLRYLGHANGLKDELTVLESLRFAAQWQGLPHDTAGLRAALEHFGLGRLGSRPARQLSQGQRRRAALAPLALPQPGSVWLLDEPFDALDDAGVTQLVALVQAHAAAGGATLFTSHQTVPALSARAMALGEGRA